VTQTLRPLALVDVSSCQRVVVRIERANANAIRLRIVIRTQYRACSGQHRRARVHPGALSVSVGLCT